LKRGPIFAVASWISTLPLVALSEPALYLGGAVNLAYNTSDGLNHSETTVEAYLYYENRGFHAEFLVGSLDQDPVDDTEVVLSLGYGNRIGRIGYDVTISSYFYNQSGHDGDFLIFETSYALSDRLAAVATAEYGLDGSDWYGEISVEYESNDRWSYWALIGAPDDGSFIYREFGAFFALNDTFGLEGVYSEASDGDGRLDLSLTFETSVLFQ